MSNLASYDPTSGMVNGWYPDGYVSPPTPNVVVSDEQWTYHFSEPNSWQVVDGVLSTYTAPTTQPTLAEMAGEMLLAGMQLVSQSQSQLNGTYPCSNQSLVQDAGTLSAINAGLQLPNGVAILVDTSGTPHAFTPDQFRVYCQVKLTFLQTLNTIIGSNTGILPVQPIVIS